MKSFKILIISIFISHLNFAQTPGFAWAKKMGNTTSQIPYGIYVDSNGNSYTTGYFSGNVDFDPNAGTFFLTASGSYDVFILKLDATGNFVWAKRIGQTGTAPIGFSICSDLLGDIYVTGAFSGTNVDFDPGAGTFPLSSVGSNDVFVLKLTSAGNFVWAKSFGGTNGDRGYAINLDNNNNVYITGEFTNTVDFDPSASTFTIASNGSGDAFIEKLDVNGNFLWVKTIGGVNLDDSQGIVADAANNTYITGRISGTVDLDPGPGVLNLFGGTYLLKLDPAGNLLWARTMLSTVGNEVELDNLGNPITLGWYSGTVDFDPGATVFNLTSVGGEDCYVQKLDVNGGFIWAKSYGGVGNDYAIDLTIDGNNNIYTVGGFSATCDFDPGAGTFTLSAASTINGFIQKLDGLGNFIWAGAIVGASSVAQSVDLDMLNNIYSCYDLTGGADFDPGVGNYFLSSSGSDDIAIQKMAACSSSPPQPSSIIGSNSLCNLSTSLNYSVAAVSGATSYSWTLPGTWTGTSTTNIISVTSGSISGNISVTANNACGSSSATVLSVTVNPLPIISVSSGSICTGQSFTMVPSGASTYTYSGGSAVVSPTATTSYSVTGTSTAGCVSASAAVSNITVNALPTISVNSGSICAGQSFTMIPSGASTYTYSSGSAIVSPTATTSYSVTGTSTAGCVSSTPATSNLTVNPLPTITANTSSSVICGPPYQGTATINATGASTYTWNTSATTASISVSPSLTTTYTVTGTSTAGCTNTATITQSVSACTNINSLSLWERAGVRVFPNPFSTVITILSGGEKQTIAIYNTFGELVHTEIIEQEKTEIDLHKLPSGLYFIKSNSGIQKLIKQ